MRRACLIVVRFAAVALAGGACGTACVTTDIFPERGGVWIDDADTANLAVDSEVRIEAVPFTRASTCLDRCSQNPTRARLSSVSCSEPTCRATAMNVELEGERVWFTLTSTAPGLTTITVRVVGDEGQAWTSSHPVRFWDPARLELVGAIGRSPEVVVVAGTAFTARVSAFAQTPEGELRLRTGQGFTALETQGAVDAAGQTAHAARPGRGEVAYRLGTSRVVRPVRVVAEDDIARIEVHSATWAATPVVDEAALAEIDIGAKASKAFALTIPLKDGTQLTAIDGKPEIVPADLATVATVRDEPLYFGVSPRRAGTGIFRVRIGAAVVELPLKITAPATP